MSRTCVPCRNSGALPQGAVPQSIAKAQGGFIVPSYYGEIDSDTVSCRLQVPSTDERSERLDGLKRRGGIPRDVRHNSCGIRGLATAQPSGAFRRPVQVSGSLIHSHTRHQSQIPTSDANWRRATQRSEPSLRDIQNMDVTQACCQPVLERDNREAYIRGSRYICKRARFCKRGTHWRDERAGRAGHARRCRRERERVGWGRGRRKGEHTESALVPVSGRTQRGPCRFLLYFLS